MLFYDHRTGYLHAGTAVKRFIPGVGEYVDFVAGRMLDNYDTVDAAARAWPDETIRLINYTPSLDKSRYVQ